MVDRFRSTAGSGRLGRIILVCSLALNLIILGAIGGAAAFGRFGDGPPRSFDLGVGAIARALTPQERRQVGRSLRAEQVMRHVDLRNRIDSMAAILKSDPFEPTVLRDWMQAQTAQMADVQTKAQEAVLEEIIEMTPERRAIFADDLIAEMVRERPRRDVRRSSGG